MNNSSPRTLNSAASLPAKIVAWVLIVAFTLAFGVGACSTLWMVYSGAYISSIDEVVHFVDSHYIFYSEDARNMGIDALNFLYAYRFAIPVVSVVLLIALIITFCYLMWAAGRRRGSDGFSLCLLDRIPFDLYLLAIFFIFCFVFSIAEDLRWSLYNFSSSAALTFIVIFITAVLFYMTAMSFAARVKLKALIKGTLTYKALRLCWKVLVWCWRALSSTFGGVPVMWKVLLIFAAYSILSAVLLDTFIGWLVVQLAMVAVLCLLGLNMQRLKKAGEALAHGDLQHKVDVSQLYFDFKTHGQNLNSISDGMTAAVEERLKSERFKTELITNVSHDIRTPLTSIINYTDLLGKEELPPQAREYVEVLTRQAQRLRKLTEDVLEASKASSGAVKAEMRPTDINELIGQCGAEYAERFEKAGLIPVTNIPCHPVLINADGRLLWRVIDNLLSNACKYSIPGTRVYLEAAAINGNAVISVRNISREPLNISADELMERFVRGDASRNTEGSGLGLSIAQSLAELMGGGLSLAIDGDLFKATLTFPLLTMFDDVKPTGGNAAADSGEIRLELPPSQVDG